MPKTTASILFTVMCLSQVSPLFCRVVKVLPMDHCEAADAAECYMLDKALEQLESNDTLLLNPGHHILHSFSKGTITNLSNITITGAGLSSQGDVIVSCSESVGFAFVNIYGLTLSGIIIENCGLSGDHVTTVFEIAREKVNIFFEPLASFSTAIFMCNIQHLHIDNVTIQHNIGHGLVGFNLIGNATFSESSILSNFPSRCVVTLEDYNTTAGGSGGGMLIIYQDYIEDFPVGDTFFTFNKVTVQDNYCCRLDLFAVLYNKLARSIASPRSNDQIDLIGAGGLSLFVAQRKYEVTAVFQSCTFRNNTSTYNGAALEITIFEAANNSHVHVLDSVFEDNGGGLVDIYGRDALDPIGALLLVYYHPIPTHGLIDIDSVDVAAEFLGHLPSTVLVSRTNFTGNSAINGGGVGVFSYGPAIGFIQDQLFFRDCVFDSNVADYGAAIYASEISYSAFEPGVNIVFTNINVTNNSDRDLPTAIMLINFLHVTINGTNYFLENNDTAIGLYSSIITISGTTVLRRNVGSYGGAMKLQTESYMILKQDVHLLFKENVGLVLGGAFFVDFDTIRFNLYDCFVFIEEIDHFCDLFNDCSLPNEKFNIEFVNNTAPFGSVIYGSSLSNCPWSSSRFYIDTDLSNIELLNLVRNNLMDIQRYVSIEPPLNINSTVNASNAINTLAFHIWSDTHDSNSVMTAMPGQIFTVDLRAVDQLLQPVPLTIFSRLFENVGGGPVIDQASSLIGETDRYLLLGGTESTTVPIAVYGQQNTRYVLMITTDESPANLTFHVELTSCSTGFVYSESSLTCVCEINRELPDVTCENDGTVTYPIDDWIGLHTDGSYIKYECIYDYCEVNVSHISLDSPDDQCRNNRAGVLCGGCAANYSRKLGSNSCSVCTSNNFLALILVFGILGVLLVVVIAAFNITITDGYINGFIFYSNIISVYVSDLLPVSVTTGGALVALISFLNLDFGIETCFYVGMTELDLVGLELIYPFYLGGILLVIALSTKYCRIRKVTDILSNINVTHVFVTLLLLSYSSLVRTCINILGFLTLQSSSGGTTVRWRADPNVKYLEGTHILLFLLSLGLLVFLVPFSILLLFPRIPLSMPYMNKMKPFIDACTAPFDQATTFWVGFRLVCRVAIYMVGFLGSRQYQLITLAIMITLLTVFQAQIKPFKSTSRNLLDLSHLVNLSMVSIFAVYFLPRNLEQTTSTRILLIVFTAFFGLKFVILILYYVIITIPATKRLYEALKLQFLSLLLEMKKKLSLKGDRVRRSVFKQLPKKTRDSNKDSISLNQLNSNGPLSHTSVQLTDDRSATITNESADFVGLRESLLDSY